MIKISCDQTGEDLTGKRHLSVTRNSFRIQEGNGPWKNVSPWNEKGVLYFKDWDALAAWGKENEAQAESMEWESQPAREPRLSY